MPDERRGLYRKFRLLLDKRSARRTEREAQRALERGTDPKKAKRNLKEADTAFGKLASTAKKVGLAIGAAFAVGVIIDWTRRIYQAGKAVFNLGAEVGETASKFSTTFGAARKQVDDFIGSWALMAGLTRTRARDMSATMGSIAQGMGATQEASAALSEQVLRLAGDLTSFHNIPIEETLTALRSGLTGEMEPLKRFGIILRADAVDARALQFALEDGRTELSELDRMLARVQLAYEQAGVAVGDLIRTQDSQANQSRRSAAALEQMKESVAALLVEGFAVVPVFRDMSDGMVGLSTWIDANEDKIRDLGTAFGHVADFIIRSTGAIVRLVDWLDRSAEAIDRFAIATLPWKRGATPHGTPEWSGTTGVIGEDPAAAEAERQRHQAEAAQRRAELARTMAEEAAEKAEREAEEAERQLRIASTPTQVGVDLRRGQFDATLGAPTGLPIDDASIAAGVAMWGPPPGIGAVLTDWQLMMAENWAAVESAALNAALGVTGAWQDAFEVLLEEGANLEEFMTTLAGGIAGAFLGGIAEFASGKVQENIAAALEAVAYALGFTSHGNFASASAAWASAAQHTAAATAWSALAGAAGAAQSAAAGGGRGGLSGGVPSGARDIGGRIADRQIAAPEIHIYIDPLDPHNPSYAKNVAYANRLGRELGPNAKVAIHPRSAGGP